MSDPFRLQKIQNWAAEFAESDAARKFPPGVQEHAASLAEAFLAAACAARDVEPDALNEADAKIGLLRGAGRLALPQAARLKAPEFCAAFLEALTAQGRLAAGKALAPYVRALRSAYLAQAGGASQGQSREPGTVKQKPLTRPGSKLGPNDPCPCGSGKKYKKCCKIV